MLVLSVQGTDSVMTDTYSIVVLNFFFFAIEVIEQGGVNFSVLNIPLLVEYLLEIQIFCICARYEGRR